MQNYCTGTSEKLQKSCRRFFILSEVKTFVAKRSAVQEEGIKRRHHFCPNPFIAETDLFLTLTLIFILHNNLASAATKVRCRQWERGGLSSQDPTSS